MSVSTSSPEVLTSALPEELPHTPEPSRPPSPLFAHASPLAVFGPDTRNEDDEPPAPLTADVVASDVTFDELSEDDVSVEQALPVTPEVHTIGRKGFNRGSVFLKVVIMHLYAARCMFTLTHHCLQLAHVIPVSAPASFLRFLERTFGDKPNTLNRHSSRNIWLLDASMHHNIDKGLIKLLPAMRIMQEIRNFTALISDVRIRRLEHKHRVKIADLQADGHFKIIVQGDADWDIINNEVNKERDAKLDALIDGTTEDALLLQRTKCLPPALYPYLVIGIRCHKEYTFTRQVVNDNNLPPPSGPTTSDTQKPFKFPLKVPADMLQKEEVDNFKQPTTFRYLRGIEGKKKELEVIDPQEYDENRVFNLGQDPCLVLANVGEFLHVTRERLQRNGAIFRMANIVVEKVHQEHLRFSLDIFREWKINDERILKIEGILEKRAKDKAGASQSRKSGKARSTHSYNTRSRTSEIAKGLLDNFRPGSRPGFDSRSRDHVSIRDGDPPSPSSRVTRQSSHKGSQWG